MVEVAPTCPRRPLVLVKKRENCLESGASVKTKTYGVNGEEEKRRSKEM